ncbi:hypothetical protein LUX01_09750 [Streptomyces sudanensis]|uniref:hypothetical protein n=1 Tax=Streptomyces sudanensis TaxID=436397 RepID=UPI0020CEC603|nr:hypothetical protein [Streptomyces sudanensis]MCP9986940.1 hypothetical protein [Streptomyces sudanensis]
MSTVMIAEHPAWHPTPTGAVRAVEHGGTTWVARWSGNDLTLHPVGVPDVDTPPVARTSAIHLPRHPDAQPLVDELTKLGTVQRLDNPSLWDAIATAILRQVVRAGQARKIHEAFCAAYGRHVQAGERMLALMPTPDVVLDLPDKAFKAVGATFNRVKLRAAAEAYRQYGEQWRTLDPESLAKELRTTVYGVGEWTAAAAAADFTGDHSVYPHGDLAVRTWARKAAPALQLPESEREFEALWRFWAPDRTSLHTLTLMTLTWGSHVHTAQHGGTQHHP